MILVFLCFLGFSNGWIVTSCMMIGSDYCPDSMAGRASGVLVDHKIPTSKFQNLTMKNQSKALEISFLDINIFFRLLIYLVASSLGSSLRCRSSARLLMMAPQRLYGLLFCSDYYRGCHAFSFPYQKRCNKTETTVFLGAGVPLVSCLQTQNQNRNNTQNHFIEL